MQEFKVYVKGRRIKDIGIASPKSTLSAVDREHALKEATRRVRRHELVGKVTVRVA